MDHDERYYRKPWMSDDQWECAKLAARIHGGFHHMAEVKQAYTGIKVQTHPHHLATYDYNNLTELVFAAHDACIRIEMAQGGPGRVALLLHKRHKRDGSMFERHPTLEQAVASWRERNPASQPPDAGEWREGGRLSTHHVHRGSESLPCYCGASSDHPIGDEQ
jgi:hypothetical protein